MTNVAIIRCEKNENSCPLTNCFKCLINSSEAFREYDECVPCGVFTCRCSGDNIESLAKILKAKGADVIHFCTCLFSKKTPSGWVESDGGFCSRLDDIMERVNKATGLTCVKGTAHLPSDYQVERIE